MIIRTRHPEPSLSPTLPDRLRDSTRDLHAEAERSGIMATLLRGSIDRDGYAALLRNLHPLYAALERGLEAGGDGAALAPLRLPGLWRTAALADDLALLAGRDWAQQLPLLPATHEYVQRLHGLADSGSPALAAHAYVRYLGDLNGGRVLRRLVAGGLGLQGEDGLRFYAFGDPATVLSLRTTLRAALAALPLAPEAHRLLEAEARWSFGQHIRLFEALAAWREPAAAGTPPR